MSSDPTRVKENAFPDLRNLSTMASDTTGDDVSRTGSAPLFRPLAPTPEAAIRHAQRELQVGDRFDDFELLTELGRGSFARVFLAWQISLNRYVALKISADRGGEARTLARLEHDHIVHVYAETVHAARQMRVLCMQYVPGTTLAGVIDALAHRPRAEWSGQAILDAIDTLSHQPAAFEPAALRDREILSGCDFVEAVCWIGARLAEAVAYAHSQDVLHRDIKPANVLLSRYGRPLLADFNVAFDPRRLDSDKSDSLGGTLAYMAPEHLDAWGQPQAAVVDRRADIYSLGVVLFELLIGTRPFQETGEGSSPQKTIHTMAVTRRARAPGPRDVRPDIPEELDCTIRRCLQPCPDDRYQDGHALAAALEGCRRLHQTRRELPPAGVLTRLAFRHPFLMLLALTLLPHVVGSAVNISYNQLRIVSELAASQQAAFHQVVNIYNAVIYVVCGACLYALIYPLYRAWRYLDRCPVPDAERVSIVRCRALRLSIWAIVLGCLGWLPGGLLFPVAISAMTGPVGGEVYGHFALSFTISGLIALTYSFLAVQFLVLRVLYPRLWVDARELRDRAATELSHVRARLRWAQLLAGLIPLTGAVLMVAVGPEQAASYGVFRILVTALIALGMLGFGLALATSSRIERCVAAFTG